MIYRCRVLSPKEALQTVSVPGSKSITNRALLLSVLAEGESVLEGVQMSEDSAAFLHCVRELGYTADVQGTVCTVRGGAIPKRRASLFVENAGTAARFLTALLGLTEGEYFLDSADQMKRRPMQPLLDSLVSLGAAVEYAGEPGHFPFRIKGCARGGDVSLDIGMSSQFLSGLLIAAPIGGGLKVTVTGEHGMAYVQMTADMMRAFGAVVNRKGNVFSVPAGRYLPQRYAIEPDVSAACYFYALAALCRRRIRVRGVTLPSLQGDTVFLSVLRDMGAELSLADGVVVQGTGTLHGVNVDMREFSDQAITLAAIAPFADSPTRITGIGHIRLQESDRIAAMAEELHKLGARVRAGEDWIEIAPSVLHGGTVDPHGDHRMAMGFSLIGCRVEGIAIADAECCGKTFAGYFDALSSLAEEA